MLKLVEEAGFEPAKLKRQIYSLVGLTAPQLFQSMGKSPVTYKTEIIRKWLVDLGGLEPPSRDNSYQTFYMFILFKVGNYRGVQGRTHFHQLGFISQNLTKAMCNGFCSQQLIKLPLLLGSYLEHCSYELQSKSILCLLLLNVIYYGVTILAPTCLFDPKITLSIPVQAHLINIIYVGN